jgi:hypothetical protein
MNPDEVNILLQTMSNKINQLTQQNTMLESKITYLNSIMSKMQGVDTPTDGGNFDNEETKPLRQNNGKTKQQVPT